MVPLIRLSSPLPLTTYIPTLPVRKRADKVAKGRRDPWLCEYPSAHPVWPSSSWLIVSGEAVRGIREWNMSA